MTADEEGGAWIVGDKEETLAITLVHHWSQIAAQPLPFLLQRNYALAARLQMSMIRSCGTALRTVIEYHHLRIFSEQLIYLGIHPHNLLRLMLLGRYREVYWKDGERIYQQVISIVHHHLHLLLGAILLTQETGSLLQCLSVYLGTRRYHSCRIPLYSHRQTVTWQFARLHVL